MLGPPEDGPLESVRQFIAGFNNNDVELAQAACAEENSIIDDFPPHAWIGAAATTRWFGDMARIGTEFGMSEPHVTLAESPDVIVSDQGAYVTVAIDVRWLQDGAPATRAGFLTLALRDSAAGWRISALAWTWS
jgi:SnoaL-like domain